MRNIALQNKSVPHRFCFKPLALALGYLAVSGGTHAAVFDLNTWGEKGPPNNGNWVVGGGGDFVTQTVNGSPTFFVSPDTLIDRTFSGTIQQIQSGGFNDDDYFGIVFGYQSPTGNTSSDTSQDFFSFAWKQGAQSGDPAGMFLTRVNGTNRLSFGNYDTDANRAGHTTIANNLVQGGWLDNTDYNFTLDYRTDRITIDIESPTDPDFATSTRVFDIRVGDVNAALANNGEAEQFVEFPSGNFGFFNHSQANVRYSGIAADADPIADAGGPYSFDAANLTVTLDGSGSIDPDGGAIESYNWTTEGGGNPSGVSPILGIVDSGLTSTTDTASVTLDVVDDEGTSDPDGDTAGISYENTPPAIIGLSATEMANGDVMFSFSIDDDDLNVNTLIANFESVGFEIDSASTAILSAIGDGFFNGSTSVDGGVISTTVSYANLLSVYGTDGVKNFFVNAFDGAGAIANAQGSFTLRAPDDNGGGGPVDVPSPSPLALLGIGLLSLVRSRRRAP